jgi:hypothetical protein
MLSHARCSLLSHAHLRSVRAMWHPLGTRHRRSFFQHPVNLFQSETLGLWDEQVCIEETQYAERTPEEENLGSKIDTAACS